MAVVTCPKCPTSLRIPDGVSGNVKCPKCSTLFPVASSGPPAAASTSSTTTPRSVAPPPVPPKPAAAPRSAAPPAKAADSGFEVVDDDDEPRSKKKTSRYEDDDDDEPRSKKKSSRYDDEDDDEPRRKKRKEYDDDDDDEPRSKKKKRDDDDDDRPRKKKKSRDDDDWRVSNKKTEGHGPARIGLMLLTISSWLYFSIYALLTLGVFLVLVFGVGIGDPGASRPTNTSTFSKSQSSFAEDFAEMIVLLIGLIGLANWVVSIIGFGFCIAGPERSKAISIITTSICGVHLLLVIVCFSIASSSISSYSKMGGLGSISMVLFATTMPFLDGFIPSLIYGAKSISGEFIIIVLTGVCEVARIFFTFLTIRTLANEGKNESAANRAQLGIIGTAIIVGASTFIMLLVIVLLFEAKFKSIRTYITVFFGPFFLQCLAYTLLLVLPAITAMGARSTLGSRRR